MWEDRLGGVTKAARAEEEERLARLARLQQEELPGFDLLLNLILSSISSYPQFHLILNLIHLLASLLFALLLEYLMGIFRVAEDEKEQRKENQEEDKNKVQMISSSESDDCKIVQDDHRSPVFQDDDADVEEDVDEDEDPNNSGLHVNDALNVANAKGEVLVNVGHPDGDRDALLAPQLAAMAKPHQIGGIRFLYDNIIESEERFRGSQGFGCILAHSMGLGKTFQVVAFVDIFLACTGGRKVLCIVPINTIQNWLSEFNYWLPAEGEKTPLAGGLSCPIKCRRFPIHLLNDSLKSLQVCVGCFWLKCGHFSKSL